MGAEPQRGWGRWRDAHGAGDGLGLPDGRAGGEGGRASVAGAFGAGGRDAGVYGAGGHDADGHDAGTHVGRAGAIDPVLVDAAHEAIRVGSRSFAAASMLFAPTVRDDARLLYAWCRHCDDEVDGQALGLADACSIDRAPDVAMVASTAGIAAGAHDAAARLAALRARTLALLRGEPATSVPDAALAMVVRRHPIDARLPLEHLDGFAMDVDGVEYESLDALRIYCRRVAGVVGEMMAAVMGVRDAATIARANDLGIAFQLTNIARDVVDDALIGRVYLPRDWLRAAGLPTDAAALADPALRGALVAPVARLLDAAEPLYASARIGVRALPPRSAWAVGTALRTYRAIGTRVRARGARAWDSRTSTSTASKLAHAVGAMPAAIGAGSRPRSTGR